MKLYKYFTLGSDIFAGISDLKISSLKEFEKVRQLLPSYYDYRYIQRRLETEKKIYDLFSAKGGAPEKRSPYYLTLGCCDQWFFGRKNCFGSLVFDLDEFDIKTVSFTYGDSIPTFMEEYDDGKEYRKNVYTLEEIKELVFEYGYPQQWNPFADKGPENYIEAQIWSDKSILTCRPCGYFNEDDILAYVPHLALRMLYAKGISTENQLKYKECISIAVNSPWWEWFSSLILNVDQRIFQSNIVHGFQHAYKCALMAIIMASLEKMDEVNTKTIVLAALYHDIGRKYYDNGRSHGQIGADIVSRYIDMADCVNIYNIQYAIRFHDSLEVPDTHETLKRLRDLDTLDYLRLGLALYNPRYLRTAVAQILVLFALELNIRIYLNAETIFELINKEK